ncbi:unnamed protein product [Caenorhabditis angaria]|uniref:Transcription factor Dp-1 n=1 Tax=Caenorhabditis angaria TaxID=860376 RepID=A0A9P1MZ58_9PELO|nr:unnamed protein product [Caenorhabditis angaria]
MMYSAVDSNDDQNTNYDSPQQIRSMLPSNGEPKQDYGDPLMSYQKPYDQNHPSSSSMQNIFHQENVQNESSSQNVRYYSWADRKPQNLLPSSEPMPRPMTHQDRPTGLRHFSTKVCEKVKQKGLTNYNEVADELVAEYFENNMIHQVDVVKQEFDMKNIRRRVYDALNVLLAMNIITKNKKDIRWLGLPASSAQEITRLEEEKKRREQSIKSKLETLQEMIVQLVTYKNLVAKNRDIEKVQGRPDQNSLLYLPFLIVNTNKDALVDCSVSSDKSEYLFSFDKPFEIHDDIEILKKLDLACGLDNGTSTPEQLTLAKSHLPPLIRPYVDDIIERYKKAELEKEQRELEEQRKRHREEIMEKNGAMYLQRAQMSDPMAEYHVERQHEQAVMRRNTRPTVPQIRPQTTQVVRQIVGHQQNTQHNGNVIQRQRYYVQKPGGMLQQVVKTENNPSSSAPHHVRQIQPTQQVRQISRPYPSQQQIGERRLVTGTNAAGQPVKYYVASNTGQQQGYKYVTVPHKVTTVRAAGGGGPVVSGMGGQTQQRVVYTSQQPVQSGQRIIQRVYTGPPGQPGSSPTVRKIVKRIVVPSKGGIQGAPHIVRKIDSQGNVVQQRVVTQHQHQPQIYQRVVHQPQQNHMVLHQQSQQHQNHYQTQQYHQIQQQQQHEPMSSQQSDMLQQQQQQEDVQFDDFYDMTDDQLMGRDSSHDLNFQ